MRTPSVCRAAATVAAALFFIARPAVAHDPGLSSLELLVESEQIVATLSLATSDAGVAGATDAIDLRIDGVQLTGVVKGRTFDEQSGATVVAVFARVPGSRLTVRSDIPFRLARGHRQLLTVRRDDDLLAERMLDAQSSEAGIDLGSAGGARSVAEFVELGVHHILTGYDHLLFLAALLLGVSRLRDVVKTVTAFTVAHSLTLALAVLGLVQLPSQIVEPIIAASIVWVGVENLLRDSTGARWRLTFAFGLVHGFGFAGVLQELGIGRDGLGIAMPLAAFNAGVEIGQLGVAMLLWPMLRFVNARPALRLRVAPACSGFVIVAGAYWLFERVLT